VTSRLHPDEWPNVSEVWQRGLAPNRGRPIPAGTGAMMNTLREVAVKRGALIREERERDVAFFPRAQGSDCFWLIMQSSKESASARLQGVIACKFPKEDRKSFLLRANRVPPVRSFLLTGQSRKHPTLRGGGKGG
jgi:hypothetical protein